jgi:hypothetical protein
MPDELPGQGARPQEIPVIAEMADLLSKQKLVPFFGAGISQLPAIGAVVVPRVGEC